MRNDSLVAVGGEDGDDDPLLTSREFGDRARVSQRTVLKWAAEGRIRGLRLGRRVLRFRQSELKRFLDGGANKDGGQ
jgi:excisionase family DNA binding protein